MRVAALLFVYPYLGAGLYVIVRHGFRDSPSTVERKKYPHYPDRRL